MVTVNNAPPHVDAGEIEQRAKEQVSESENKPGGDRIAPISIGDLVD